MVTVKIYVYDVNTMGYIEGALIQADGQEQMTSINLPDPYPYVAFTVNPGTINITISKAGYNTSIQSYDVTSDVILNYGLVTCFTFNISANKYITNVGDQIILSSDYPYDLVNFKRDGVYIGHCLGTCSLTWDTAGLIPGTYSITATITDITTGHEYDCITASPLIITLGTPAQAGFGTIEMIFIGGLAVGAIYLAIRKSKKL